MKKVKMFSVMLAIALSALGTVAFKSEDGTRSGYLTGACSAVNNTIPDTCQSGNPGNQCVVNSSNAWEMSGCGIELKEPF